jgi:ABC-type polysaccharide/polyol phosphate export permease
MTPWLRALAAVARRDAHILLSYRSTFLSRPASVVFTLALFYFVSRLVSVARFDTPDAYFAFVAIGLVIYGVIRSSLEVPQSVRQELVGGTYERLELSAAGATAGVAGMLITPFLYALFLSAFTLVFSALVFGVDVQWSTAAIGIPLGALGALAFAPFALVFCAITLAFKEAPGQGAVLPSLSLVSGLYFPVDLLPGWLRWLSEVQPLTPLVDLMRHVLIGFPLEDPAGFELLRLLGFAILGLPLAIWSVSAARRFSRVRGTVLES